MQILVASRNRQPCASDARPCAALRARRCRQTAQFESQTSCTLPLVLHQPMHTVRQQPARKLQQLATDVHTDAGDPRTTQRRFARTIAECIYRPNQTTAVRTIRAYRRTSLCNRRAHSFAQLPQHLTRTSNSGCTRSASLWLHTMPRTSAPRVAQLRGRFSEIEDSNRV